MRRNASVRNADAASLASALDPSRRRARVVARRGTPWVLALMAVAALRYCLTPAVPIGDIGDAHSAPATTARHRARARAGPLWESEQLATTGGQEGEEEEEDANGDDDPGLEVRVVSPPALGSRPGLGGTPPRLKAVADLCCALAARTGLRPVRAVRVPLCCARSVVQCPPRVWNHVRDASPCVYVTRQVGGTTVVALECPCAGAVGMGSLRAVTSESWHAI